MVPDLATLRAAIDRLDASVAAILARRARLAQRVALLKQIVGEPPRDLRREEEVRDAYARILTAAGWSEASVDDLLGTMLHASRDLQARVRVAIQGGMGSWSELSLLAHLPNIRVLHCPTWDEVRRALRSGAAAAAWLPRHNSTVGRIHETDAIADGSECWLEAEQPIPHALLARPGLGLADVEVVEGHPRALAQCRANLARHVPRAQLASSVDGAHSAARLAGPTAIVGAPALAERYGLDVLVHDLSDQAGNRTTFQLLVPREAY